MYIWKRTYNPFSVGGKVINNIKTKVDDFSVIELSKGFKGIYIEMNGKSGVYELESGGLVGETIEQVNLDINTCSDIELMKSQITESKKELEAAKEVLNEEFFK